MEKLKQELESFRPTLICSCDPACSYDLLPNSQAQRESDYVIAFLKGLNENYTIVRSQIMLMNPLLDIDKAFDFLSQ
uniref:Retrovirus-related Pol polyprotein from transposon TNT 1-94 n=1 Tax=Cajanus cajan TaxID=3821 RepID=A0A151SE81_CAJCA|nr:hypothetical protein KK1_024962 [Cajanus cajan]